MSSHALYNRIPDLNSPCTFDNYQPTHESQQTAAESLLSLASAIIGKKRDVFRSNHPFPRAKFIILTGKPGLGKTHLLEAFANQLLLADRNFGRRIFYGGLPIDASDISEACPILLLDDLFSNRQSISDFVDIFETKPLMGLITTAYERRSIVVCTSNFSISKGVLRLIKELDHQERVTNRLSEMMGTKGELVLIGENYRSFLAEQLEDNLFSL